MNKQDLAGYLVSLHTLVKEIETNAGVNRPKWLTDEYTRAYSEFRNTVEKDNETRNREQQSGSDQAGVDLSSGKPNLRGEYRSGSEPKNGPDDAGVS